MPRDNEHRLVDREAMTQEAAKMAVACWNHYSDVKLTPKQEKQVRAALDRVLPQTALTTVHNTRVIQYKEDADAEGANG